MISKSLYEQLVKETEFRLSTNKMKFTDVANTVLSVDKSNTVDKAKYVYENDEAKGVLKRTIVANTYNWMDSHDDVHLSGIFAKSIQERANKIPHLHDHKFEIGAKVGRPASFAEVPMKWRQLGWEKNGDTQALMMVSQIEKRLNEKVYDEYLNDQVDQHSVSMQYVKIELAANDENYVQEYKAWQEVFPLLGNKAQAEQKGYFWVVREAKLIEVSAVLLGSNELTPTMGSKIFQPDLSTEKTKPDYSTLKEQLKYYQPIKHI
jgi:hypothetical protein